MIPEFDYEYVSYEELYRAYLDCRKRKRMTHNALQLEIDENTNLYKLWKDLNYMRYEVGKSIVFCVDKPVKREVFAADFRDRIVHHLIINRINSILEDEFIENSYSCRVGKGTDYGIVQCKRYIEEASDNYNKNCYIVKCDLKSFFMTINKQKLYEKLINFIHDKYKVKDERDYIFMEYIIKLIVFNEPQNNCVMKQGWEHWDDLPKSKSLFFCENGFGIPIGNLTSQIFANFYLSEFDHYITETLGIKYYGRYVDDFFIITENKDESLKIIKLCRNKLASMGVTLHPHKLYIQPVSKGVKFIGAVIKKNRVYISNRTKGNFFWKMKQFSEYIDYLNRNGIEPSYSEIEHFVTSVNSYLGFMVHYKTYNIRKKILLSELMLKWQKYCYYDSNLKKLTIFSEYTRYKGKKHHMESNWYYGNEMDRITYLEILRSH